MVQGEHIEKKPKAGRTLLRLGWDLITALLAVFLIITFLFQIYGVDGPSMLGTLHDGERMFVTKLQYFFREPARFEAVICRFPDRGGENFVKRIVGVPGDTIAIEGGRLYVNGEAYEEPYASYPDTYAMAPVTVAQGHYFVMGDNRMVSHDSRYADVGPLTREQIIGKVQAVIWPLSAIRVIE